MMKAQRQILSNKEHSEMETKQKIREIVEKLPNEVLDDFQQIEKSIQERIRFSQNLSNTLTED